jgi:hypothetical protein
MNSTHTNAPQGAQRNASLLSAFALVLAFACGVSGSSLSFAFAAQQLLPGDDCCSQWADLPESPDPIALTSFNVVADSRWVAPHERPCVPVRASLQQFRRFLPRAPPALTT